MANINDSVTQNLLPVQAYFNVDGSFNTFIGQGKPFYATSNPVQSGLTITNSTLDSSPIGSTIPSTGAFTNITTTTGQITTQPSGATDIVNLLALQSYAAGISWKQPCAVATLTNITLSGLQTIDTYTTLVGDRVLVKNQTNQADNGIYIAASGTWTRALDANTWNELISAISFIEYGTQKGGAWFCTAQPGGTLGVTAVIFSQFTTSATYSAGTGLTLTGSQFSITPQGTAGTYGSASSVPVFVTNASGQVTSVTNTNIAIAASQITSGTIGSSLISGSYTGITGVGTLTAGTWNAGTIGVAYGGSGATTLTGYLKGNGTSAFTASTTIPTTDLSGTISNAQLANSTISGVSLGSNLFSLTAGTNITFSSGTTYNGSAAITINATVPAQVYPGAGIANSTGSAWGTSYSTTGSGTVVALATSPSFTTPALGVATGTSVQVTGGFYSTSSYGGSFTDGIVVDYITGTGRFSVGTSDGFAWYNAGVANTSIMSLSSVGALTAASFSGAGTGLTGTASSLSIGGNAATATSATSATSASTATTATNATNIAITDNTSSSSTYYPVLSLNSSGNNAATTSSTKLSFVPSTGILTLTSLTSTNDASISGLTVGKGGGAVANNTAVGYQAGYSNTTGTYNLFSGALAGYSNTTGLDLVAIGYGAGYGNQTGNDNVFIGQTSGPQTTTTASGSNNIGIGTGALRSNTTASNNTAVGYQAGYSNTTGQYNSFIGENTGANLTTGSQNIYVGPGVIASGVAVTNEICIGQFATGKGANTGYINANSGGVYQGNNSATWSITSDQRLKKNIVNNATGLDAISQIQVRNFEYRTADEVTDLPSQNAINISGVQLGAIAQELQAILPECVKTESTGVMSVDTTNLTWYLINAVKELNAKVTALENK